MSGPAAFGRISTNMIRHVGSPRNCAAAMNARSRKASVRPRVSRMMAGLDASVTARTMFSPEAPNFETMTM